MKREEKVRIISNLSEQISSYNHFYLADISELDAAETSELRRKCFEQEINLVVVKNTLLKKALESFDGAYDQLYGALRNSTSVLFCNTGNIPARVIREFRKKHPKPVLKAAWVEESVYLGDEQLDALSSLKSKEELIGDVLMLLQSPVRNVLSALRSGGTNLTGILKALETRGKQ